MEWLLIMFTIYGKHVGEPRWPTMVARRFGKKILKCHPNRVFNPCRGKKSYVPEGSCFIQTMTYPRVFPRVNLLLAVLQLLTAIAKGKKGNSSRIPSAVIEDLWLAEICTKFNRNNSFHQNEECRNYQHTTLVRHASLNDHQTALQIPELQKHLRTIQKKSEIYKHLRQSCISPSKMCSLCVENTPLSKFKSLQTLLHDLGLQDIVLLRETTKQYQSYFSALELAESLSDVVEEEVKEKLAKSPVVSALTDESTDVSNHKRLVLYFNS